MTPTKPVRLGDTQLLVLQLLDRWCRREGVPATVRELADEDQRLDVYYGAWLTYDKAHSTLQGLVRGGLVKRHGGVPAHYEITEAGQRALEASEA